MIWSSNKTIVNRRIKILRPFVKVFLKHLLLLLLIEQMLLLVVLDQVQVLPFLVQQQMSSACAWRKTREREKRCNMSRWVLHVGCKEKRMKIWRRESFEKKKRKVQTYHNFPFASTVYSARNLMTRRLGANWPPPTLSCICALSQYCANLFETASIAGFFIGLKEEQQSEEGRKKKKCQKVRIQQRRTKNHLNKQHGSKICCLTMLLFWDRFVVVRRSCLSFLKQDERNLYFCIKKRKEKRGVRFDDINFFWWVKNN